MEVRDRIPGVYESPIYDMNLHYEYSLKLSRYTFATNGKKFCILVGTYFAPFQFNTFQQYKA